MAHKVVLSNRFSNKLATVFTYLESNYAPEITKDLVDNIDRKITLLSRLSGLGIASSKISGVCRISISRQSKLYYYVKGKKIIMLDLLYHNTASAQ